MDKNSLVDLIMLSELPRVGDRRIDQILRKNEERGHGISAFLRLPGAVLREDYGLHPDVVHRLTQDFAAYRLRCHWLSEQLPSGAAGYDLRRASYPERLRGRLKPPPGVLFGYGKWPLLTTPTLAVLNSREIATHMLQATHAVSEAAAQAGFTLVCGGMKANHRIAAVAARAARADRIIVLDRGLLVSFDPGFQRDAFGFGPMRSEFNSERSLAISPFRLLDHAMPRSGPRRDEVIAAMADVVVAVHARPGGGIERACLQALDRGQTLLSWYGENPGLVAAGATSIDDRGLLATLQSIRGGRP